jgi:hypothetical protein
MPLQPSRRLWRVYERDWKAFSISYAVWLIFQSWDSFNPPHLPYLLW